MISRKSFDSELEWNIVNNYPNYNSSFREYTISNNEIIILGKTFEEAKLIIERLGKKISTHTSVRPMVCSYGTNIVVKLKKQYR